MNTAAEQYRQLLSLMQSHLLTEYPRNQRFVTDLETLRYFRNHQPALQQKVGTVPIKKPVQYQAPPPKVTPPPPKPVIRIPEPPKTEPKRLMEVPKRELVETKTVDEMADIRSIISKLYPHLPLKDPPSSDKTQPTEMLQHAQVYVVNSAKNATEEVFLYHLAQAISRIFVPATVVEVGMVGVETKMVIGTEEMMRSLSDMKTPYCIMPEVQRLFVQPELKVVLWHQIQQMIVTHASR